jgi:DNA (cytosine-5)-methyltransferase 1
MSLTVGSLFSGIGGLDLGLERAGMTVVWQSEIDPYACCVLAKHWPHVPNLGDIAAIDWSTVERPDVIVGGFPCQPVSRAGRRQAQADHRWLWPEVARCVRRLRPRFALLENTPGLLDNHGGMGDVLADLAALRYDAEWDSIPAAVIGAPHRRERVFIVAYPAGEGLEGRPRVLEAPRQALAEPPRSAWLPAGRPRPRDDDGLPLEVDRRRALGNAVVPQVAEWIGRRIMEAAA